jgi:hypothetical protein
MNGVDPWRPGSRQSSSGRRAGPVPALLAIVALLSACGGPAPTPTLPPTTPVPSTLSGNGSSPAPAAWAKLALADLPEVARLEPTHSGAGGVAIDTAFRLTSLDGRAPAALAARLVSNPPLALTVASVDGSTALLRPAAPLHAGTTYRFTLQRSDGSVEAAWAAQAAGPLHIVGTVPLDETTAVPTTTGIEITFDQYGVSTAELAAHFSIVPTVAGTFVVSGRTVAFAPTKPLATATLYTVTVSHGLPLDGTGQALATDTIVRFETAAISDTGATVVFSKRLVDASTSELAALELGVDVPEGGTAPTTVPVTVHRLAGLTAAEAAFGKVAAALEWARHTAIAPVSTAGLPLVLSGDLSVNEATEFGARWIQLPRALEAGWYLVTESYLGAPRQVVLQVTDIAIYALVASNRTAVWANDLATRQPIPGASVSVAGQTLGTTNAQGLLVGTTPTALAAGGSGPASGLVVVRTATGTIFRPVIDQRACDFCLAGTTETDRWWHLFSTDRLQYRSSDTVNAWGMVRDRNGGAVPSSVTVTIVSAGGDASTNPVIATATATPDRAGAFVVHLPFRNLPNGSYYARLMTGSTVQGQQWFEVRPIVKPEWLMALTPERHAAIAGTAIKASVHATFFEGTPVAGTEINLGFNGTPGPVVRTDLDGNASGAVTVNLDSDNQEQWSIRQIQATPTLPEEANLSTQADVAVFAATAIVDASPTISGSSLVITGAVHDVDFSRFEATGLDGLYSVDPRGPAHPGASVRVRIVEHRSVLTQAGTTYDFVTKRAVPRYTSKDVVSTLSTTTIVAGGDGTWHLTVPVPADPTRSYNVFASFTDSGGRTTTGSFWASGGPSADPLASLVGPADPISGNAFSVGATVPVRFVGRVANPPVARYLYATARLGLLNTVVTTSPTFSTTFTAAMVPSMSIYAVRFNGYGYEVPQQAYQATLRIADRRIAVTLTPDQARYAPGANATISIRTLGPDGNPVSASVYVQALDEKLFALGAAFDADPLGSLYASVGDGILGSAVSHEPISQDLGGGRGDTGSSGGTRMDFRDWLVATLVTTGSDGRGHLSIPLSDDLTSWRVSAGALDTAFDAGFGKTFLQVGLPFFVSATIAREYLVADRPSISVRAFGSGLSTGEPVRFTVSSDTLPMAETIVAGSAFTAVDVPLPALSIGTQRLRISATTGSGSTLRTDSMIRMFEVVATRATQARTTWTPLDAVASLTVGTGTTELTLVEAGRGRVVPILEDLATADTARSDRALAAAMAGLVLSSRFGLEAPGGGSADDLARFVRDGGVAIVPYGSADLDATVLAAMSGDPRLDAASLGSWLDPIATGPAERRDRRLLALAGLAALGRPVLPDVEAAAALSDLGPTERVSLALAALFAGDESLARTIEHDLLTQFGVTSGPWVRLDTHTAADPAVDTARLAIVAASLGDPVAADMDAWLAANPPTGTSVDLERALAARGWAMRMAGANAVVAMTVDGARREITLTPGAPVRLALTPAQASGGTLAPVSGKALVVTSWTGPLDASSLTRIADLSLTRSVTPGGTIGQTDTVVVTLLVGLGSNAGPGCWRVTDLVPSGLAPIDPTKVDSYDPRGSTAATPDSVVGQRVEFCVRYDPELPSHLLRYVARVVTPGTYAWEPAVVQSELIPDQGMALDPTTVIIRGSGG